MDRAVTSHFTLLQLARVFILVWSSGCLYESRFMFRPLRALLEESLLEYRSTLPLLLLLQLDGLPFFLCLVVHVSFFFFAGTASEKHATRHWHEMARRVWRWCQCGLSEKVVVTCWRKGGNLAKKKQQKIKQQELEVRRVIKMSCHWCICATSTIFLTWRLNDWTSEMILSVAQVKGMTFCRLFWRAKSRANSQTN